MSKKVTETPVAEAAAVAVSAPVRASKPVPTAEQVARYERGRAILVNLQREALALAELGLSGISAQVLGAASKLAKVKPGAV